MNHLQFKYHDFYKNLVDDNIENQTYDPDLDEMLIDNDD